MLVQVPSKSGGSFSAYVAPLPERPAPAVVVIQEIFGVNANIRAVCDQLAKRQLIAIAPDLFWRSEPGADLSEADREKAFALRAKTDDNTAADDVAAGRRVIAQRKGAQRRRSVSLGLSPKRAR